MKSTQVSCPTDHISRLGLVQQKLVKFNAVLCASTYIAVILTIFLHCRPLEKNWQVYPDPGRKYTLTLSFR